MMKEFRISPDDPRLTAYALGELQGQERAAVEAALEHDPVARGIVEDTRRFADQMQAALADEPEIETDPAAGGVAPGPASPEKPVGEPPAKRTRMPEYDGGGPKILRFPQLYFVIGGLAAACFAVMVALHEPKPMYVTTYTEINLHQPASSEVAELPKVETRPAAAQPLPKFEEKPNAQAASSASLADQHEPNTAAQHIAVNANNGLLDQIKSEPGVPGAGSVPETGAVWTKSEKARGDTNDGLAMGAPTAQPADSTPIAVRLVASADSTGSSSTPDEVVPESSPTTSGAVASGAAVSDRDVRPTTVALNRSGENAGNQASPGPGPGSGHNTEVVTLSPFEVSASVKSEYAANRTLAGTRVTSNLNDLGIPSLNEMKASLTPEAIAAGAANRGPKPAAVPNGGDFVAGSELPVATFSIPADTGSYEEIRRSIAAGRLPPPGQVRIEELLNHFRTVAPVALAKTGSKPAPLLTASLEVGEAPWAPRHRLVRVDLKALSLNGAAGSQSDIVARDVKLEVQFNPRRVSMYRLIGYERPPGVADRRVTTSPATGELEAGRVVIALFEVVPAGVDADEPTDEGSYGPVRHLVTEERPRPAPQLLTLHVQYRRGDTGAREKLMVPLIDTGATFAAASADFKFAAGVAAYGMVLRDSPHRGRATLDNAIAWASAGLVKPENDIGGERSEFIDLMRRTKPLMH